MFRSTVVFALFSFSLLAQSPQYTIHDLGPLNNGVVVAINIQGQVIGFETQSADHVRAFRTAPNAAINWTTDDLGTLGGATTTAAAINASGQVVGTSTLSTGETRAFRTAPNSAINPATDNLGILEGTDSRAYAINDAGRVTGASGHAFVTAPNAAINPANDTINVTYGKFQIDSSQGIAINNHGHVLGEIIGYPFYPTAFLLGARTADVVPIVSYIWQGFAGLTDTDQIVFNSGNNLQMWQSGVTTTLIDCTTPCVPTAVNNSLQIVGSTAKNQFLYTSGAIYDLAAFFPPGSGWTMPNTASGPSPLSINDLGQIVGIATFNNETHAFRLDPLPSVSSAIQQTLNVIASLYPNLGRRSTLPLMMKLNLSSELNSALNSWTRGNPSATRGMLNEFESTVKAQVGQTLTNDEANQLIQMADAAYALANP